MSYAEKLKPYIEKRWLSMIDSFLVTKEGQEILNYLTKRKHQIRIVPNQTDMFNAFKYTAWDDVRVVIIGQSPYHHIIGGKPEADGLAFSYTKENDTDVHFPKSLGVIRNELEHDIYNGELIDMNPNLDRWAKQGVLLLNSALTTEYGNADAHLGLWRPFTEYIIKNLNDYHAGLIFCLWGSHAKSFKGYIDTSKHYIFDCFHPATELYNKGQGGFYGCKHFSKVNELLLANNRYTIAW